MAALVGAGAAGGFTAVDPPPPQAARARRVTASVAAWRGGIATRPPGRTSLTGRLGHRMNRLPHARRRRARQIRLAGEGRPAPRGSARKTASRERATVINRRKAAGPRSSRGSDTRSLPDRSLSPSALRGPCRPRGARGEGLVTLFLPLRRAGLVRLLREVHARLELAHQFFDVAAEVVPVGLGAEQDAFGVDEERATQGVAGVLVVDAEQARDPPVRSDAIRYLTFASSFSLFFQARCTNSVSVLIVTMSQPIFANRSCCSARAANSVAQTKVKSAG